MSNTNYTCTYNDVKEEAEQDRLYQKDMLGVFGIDTFEDTAINESIADLYERVKDIAELQECMKNYASLFLSEDPLTGLMVMFSFDYMHTTHQCMVGYLENNQELFRTLLEKLNSRLGIGIES